MRVKTNRWHGLIVYEHVICFADGVGIRVGAASMFILNVGKEGPISLGIALKK